MAPFHQAVKVDFLRKEGDIDIYGGVVDGEWCVGVVPNGGFVLGLVVEACIKRQVGTNHPDPVHVTAHFLRATAALAPFEVHIHQLKTGRGFTNLIADLIKNGVVKITTHQYFGDLTTDSTKNASPFHLTLAPPSPYARRLPLHQHPSKAPLRTLHEAFKYSKFFKASSEPEIAARNAPDSTIRSGSETIGGNGIEWGQWATLTDDGDTLTRPLIAFMVDMITPPATLLPKSEKPNMPDASWFPTLTMTSFLYLPHQRMSILTELLGSIPTVDSSMIRKVDMISVWRCGQHLVILEKEKRSKVGERSRSVWQFRHRLLS